MQPNPFLLLLQPKQTSHQTTTTAPPIEQTAANRQQQQHLNKMNCKQHRSKGEEPRQPQLILANKLFLLKQQH
jgi:hypothetical protein